MRSRTLDRIDLMIENAINGKKIETVFDESKISALESKFHQYLKMTNQKNSEIAEEKDKIKSLISDISHQTKTPIANILLYSDLLLEDETLSEEAKEMVNQIEVQSKELNFLINALINLSRLETGVIEVHPEKNRVETLLAGIISQITPKAAEKNISIEKELKTCDAFFDPKWTGEAIYNILDNGVKYTPVGGTVKVSVLPYDLFCRIDIQDNGPGIEDEEINKIFSRFYRSPKVHEIEGVGIGLYLSREIISRQRGYIKVASKPGETLFSVFLPKEDE